MYIVSTIVKDKKENKVKEIIDLINPFIKHGAIILSSETRNFLSFFSPSPIKHCSFIFLENKKIFIIEICELGYKKTLLEDFLKYKDEFYIFYYKDLNIMNKTMNYIEKYKGKKYGFLNKDDQYCFKLIFSVYNDALNNKFKTMKEFIPVFVIMNKEFINSNSILLSKDFLPQCCIIKNKFIKFK